MLSTAQLQCTDSKAICSWAVSGKLHQQYELNTKLQLYGIVLMSVELHGYIYTWTGHQKHVLVFLLFSLLLLLLQVMLQVVRLSAAASQAASAAYELCQMGCTTSLAFYCTTVQWSVQETTGGEHLAPARTPHAAFLGLHQRLRCQTLLSPT
jgi:hypothetical protein